MGPLMSPVAEELRYSELTELSTCRRGPLGVDFVHVARTFNEGLNVELWLFPAHDSRVSMRAACPVDLKLSGEHASIW